jgi:hypothetical protein
MTILSKWNVSIEYGPTAADIHDITVEASDIFEARTKAEKWAKDNNVENPMISEPYQDDYDEFLEWTEEEEGEFTHMLEQRNRFDD